MSRADSSPLPSSVPGTENWTSVRPCPMVGPSSLWAASSSWAMTECQLDGGRDKRGGACVRAILEILEVEAEKVAAARRAG